MTDPNTHLMDRLTDDERQRAEELVADWLPWLYMQAAMEARHGGRPDVIGLHELMETTWPQSVDRQNEMQYRRGYCHGYSEAMDDLICAGTSRSKAWNQVARFYDGPLQKWAAYREPIKALPPTFTAWLRKAAERDLQ